MNTLDDLRKEVSSIDDEIFNLLTQRFVYTNSIGALKRSKGIPIENLKVEAEKLASYPDMVQSIYKEIFKVSKQCQSII